MKNIDYLYKKYYKPLREEAFKDGLAGNGSTAFPNNKGLINPGMPNPNANTKRIIYPNANPNNTNNSSTSNTPQNTPDSFKKYFSDFKNALKGMGNIGANWLDKKATSGADWMGNKINAGANWMDRFINRLGSGFRGFRNEWRNFENSSNSKYNNSSTPKSNNYPNSDYYNNRWKNFLSTHPNPESINPSAGSDYNNFAMNMKYDFQESINYIIDKYDELMNSSVIHESSNCHPALIEKYNEDVTDLKLLIDCVVPEVLNDSLLPPEIRDEMCDKFGMNYDDEYTGCDFGPEIHKAWNSYISEPKCMDNFKRLDCIKDKISMLKDPKLAMQICGVATAATLYFMWKTFMHMKFDVEPCDNKMLSNILFVTGSLPSKLDCVKESYDYKNDKSLMESFNTLIENAYSLNSLIMHDVSVPSVIKIVLDEEFNPFRMDFDDISIKPVMESYNYPINKKKIF